MNLRVVSILFVVLFLFETRNVEAFNRKGERADHVVEGAKLVVALKADHALQRSPRGSDSAVGTPTDTHFVADGAAAPKNNGAGPAGEKRNKNGGHKKSNRNQDINTQQVNRRKSHADKQLLSGADDQQQSHQHSGKRQQLGNRQQHGGAKGNKQRQILKAQQHQGHQGGKRNGQKENGESVNHEINSSKTQSSCRYTKSEWSDCDPKTNTHSRRLILKKGDNGCLPERTIEKRCRRATTACRYDKGAWSVCKDGQMVRVDKLKASTASTPTAASDLVCEASRTISRKCNPDGSHGKSSKPNGHGKGNKKERKSKDKATNRGSQPN